MTRPSVTTVVVLAALVGACRGPDDARQRWSGTVSDSAGVRVVHNPVAPLWSPEEGWWVEEVARVTGDDAEPATLLGFVADVAADAEGRLFVLDQQARAVRVFSADGTYLRTLGGPGEGPGELGQLVASVVVRGDEVWVADWVQARMSRYLPDGTALPSFPLPHSRGARSWWDEGADGELYFRTLSMSIGDDGAWTGQDHLQRMVGTSPGRGDGPAPEPSADTVTAFQYQASNLGARGAPRLPPVVNAPAWTVLADGTLAWITLDATEVRLRSADGAETRIRSDAWAGHAPSQAEEAALKLLVGERLEMLGGTAETVNQIPVDFPATLPVLTDLRAGPGGTLLVQRAGPARDVHPMALNTPDPPKGWGGAAWDVLSSAGHYLGSLELPARFRVMAITDSTVVGVQADPYRVDQVVVLRLHLPEREGSIP